MLHNAPSGGLLGTQADLGDLDLFLDGNSTDFLWTSLPQQAVGTSTNDFRASKGSDLPPQPPLALDQNDLFLSSWPSLGLPPMDMGNHASQQMRPAMPPSLFEQDFGKSFDFSDLTSVVPDPLRGPSRTSSPLQIPELGARQLSENLNARSPVSADDTGDIRVTFKDKMNPPQEPAKALSLAERNKQAQRRHRQRQKDRMGMLEAQVKQLTEEKQELAAEKAALAGQNAVLTQVLATRDEQLQQARERGHQNSMAFPARTETSLSSRPTKEEVVDSDSKLEGAVSPILADSLQNILTLTVRRDQAISLDASQVKALSPQQMARLWAEYLSAMMKELEIVNVGSQDQGVQAEKRIKLLLQEVMVLLMRYALGDLHKMKTFVASYLDASHRGTGVSERMKEVWRAASNTIKFNDTQRQSLLALRQAFMSKQNKLVSQRVAAIRAMQKSIPNPVSSHDIALQFLRTEQAMKMVQAVLHKENQLIVDLVYTLLLRVISPIQAARCLVSSYPSYPDCLCILTWIAAEAGDTEAMRFLGLYPAMDGNGNLSSNHSHSGGDLSSS